MPTVYVQSKSKKLINESLKQGKDIETIEFKITSTISNYLSKYPSGTVVKIYEKVIYGNPLAKSYAVWDKEKNIIK